MDGLEDQLGYTIDPGEATADVEAKNEETTFIRGLIMLIDSGELHSKNLSAVNNPSRA